MSKIDIRRVARTLSLVENRRPEAEALLRDAYHKAAPIPVVGVAGPPGAGKSTLVDRLAANWAEGGERVAVIAIDPSSPYTGGAVLGDRFRMEHAAAHSRVFVRSLSSRGHVGGLSLATTDMVTMLSVLGFDRVIVETVGSGQADVEVAALADCVVVLAVPGLGDQVQAAKAGILEIGDIFVVNKRDTPGAQTIAGHLEANLDLIYDGKPGVNRNESGREHGEMLGNKDIRRLHGARGDVGGSWRPPVLLLSARDGSGVEALKAAVDDFLLWQKDSGRREQRRAGRFRQQILQLVYGRLLAICESRESATLSLAEMSSAVARGDFSPSEAADLIIADIKNSKSFQQVASSFQGNSEMP